MKETTIESIANKLNVSKSMVSKVLRHCGGVDSETRHRILAELQAGSYTKHSDCAVYTIVPDTPKYFWKPLREGIADATQEINIPVKYNVYTKASDESAVLKYLDEAKVLNARAIILATHITPAIHDKLATMTEGRLIVLLSEYHELINSFYIGSDAYSEGYTMGKHYISHYADRKTIILSRPQNKNVRKRIDGFYQAVSEVNPKILERALFIELNDRIFKDFKLIPSKIAPLLADVSKQNERLCIYSPIGIPQFPLAIIKAKLTNNTVCLCHDCYTENPYPEKNLQNGFVVTCNQDGYAQGFAAAQMALDFIENGLYPEHKKNYIPSHLNVAIKYSDAI